MELFDREKIARDYQKLAGSYPLRIIICAGTGCLANGSMKVYEALKEVLESRGIPVAVELRKEGDGKGVHLSHSGCQGFCQMGPLVAVEPDGILYVKVKKEDVQEIVERTILKGELIDRLLDKDPATGKLCKGQGEIPFYKRQHRFTLDLCGKIDPEDIAEYIANGGYEGAEKAFKKMTPQVVCEEVLFSGLRGRGGGGFPTGRKWEFARKEISDKKYVICNGDEGDPGAFMDRSVMEGNPHSVVEGIMIAARGIGADEGYVYVRTEYPLAVARMRKAVAEAEKRGILGDNIFGTSYSCRIHVMEGAGAFVCGEETALMSSIEGNRGMPLPKPPFPAQKGLWGKPTVINNVETLATVPLILRMGAAAFKKLGTEKSPGTKTFALTGHVANTGLIEVPLGTSLREIVHHIGGGVTNKKGEVDGEGFKAVQIGGPSGGCLTEEHLDLPLDFDTVKTVGAMIGSGGLVVMNKDTCIVQIARFFMQFTQNESCGKCVPCREGTKQMLALLDDIIEGRATMETLDLLEDVAWAVNQASLCGLGKTAPNPVLSTLKNFRAEYEAHVLQKKCPTRQCKALSAPEIDPNVCKGCSLCSKKCPVGAISGELKKPFKIDPDKCIRCGTCVEVCKFKAIK